MDNYFNSKKYIILLVVVCLLFTIITIKVFDYMPKPEDNAAEYNNHFNRAEYNQDNQADNSNSEYSDNEVADDDNNDDDDDNSDEEENDDIQHKSGHIDFEPKSYSNLYDFDEIPAPKGSNEEIIQTYDTN